MIYKGRNRDTAWFAMIDKDWPEIRAGFERWLAADNFDASGAQRKALKTGLGGALPETAPPSRGQR
jgi:hypothetical protein